MSKLSARSLAASPPADTQPAAGSLTGTQRGRTIALNAGVLTFGQLLGRVTGLIFTPFIARQLGSTGLATYNLSNVLISYFSIIVLFGLGPLVVRDMSQSVQDIPLLFARALATRLIFAVLALAGLGALLDVSNYPGGVTELALILSVALFAVAVTDSADTVFQAHQRMGYSVVVTLSATAVYLVLGWGALHAGFGLVGLAIANSLGWAVRASMALAIIRKLYFAPRLAWSWQAQKALLRAAIPFFLGAASATLLNKVDVFVLSRMVPLRIVGFYIAGYFFLDLSVYLPNAFAQAIYPVLARTAAQARASLRDATDRFCRAMLAVALLMTVTVVPIAHFLIHLLYGRAFGASVRVLQIVIWSVPLVTYNATVGRAIFAAGGQWSLVAVAAVAAASDVVINLALIPGMGIIASSLATIASFAVNSLLTTYYARRYGCAIPLTPLLRLLLPGAAGLVAGLVLARLYAPGAIVGVPLVYTLVLFKGRYFTAEEKQMTLGLIAPYLGAARRAGA
jgi:O-antigen/teichoic acid export membrane protein